MKANFHTHSIIIAPAHIKVLTYWLQWATFFAVSKTQISLHGFHFSQYWQCSWIKIVLLFHISCNQRKYSVHWEWREVSQNCNLNTCPLFQKLLKFAVAPLLWEFWHALSRRKLYSRLFEHTRKKKKKSSGLKKGLLALTIFNTPENLRVNETKCYFSTGKKQF